MKRPMFDQILIAASAAGALTTATAALAHDMAARPPTIDPLRVIVCAIAGATMFPAALAALYIILH